MIKRIRTDKILPARPLMTGISTAFDMFGVNGLQMYSRIHDHWIAIVSQPCPSAEESVLESVASVNAQIHGLLAERER